MKLKFLFDYLSYAVPAFAFALLAKLFSFLSKKCAALALRAEHLLERQQTKLEDLKARRIAALRENSPDKTDGAEFADEVIADAVKITDDAIADKAIADEA